MFKVLHFWHLLDKCMQHGSQKAWILRLKIEKNREKWVLKNEVFLDIVLASIFGGFGQVFGRVWEALGLSRSTPKASPKSI